MDFKTLSKPLGFKPNITPVYVIKNQRIHQRFKKGAFGGTYFIDMYFNRQINRWKRIVNRFVDILNKLIREGKDRKKIRQTLLHWCYELTLS